MLLPFPQRIKKPTVDEQFEKDIPIRVRDFFVLVDFVVLDMDVDTRTPLILWRPFLSTTNANIDVGVGEIRLNINGEEEWFTFKPKVEQ
jgi:hypothetical protein